MWKVVFEVMVTIIAVFFANKGADAISVVTSKVEKRTITQTVSAIGRVELNYCRIIAEYGSM